MVQSLLDAELFDLHANLLQQTPSNSDKLRNRYINILKRNGEIPKILTNFGCEGKSGNKFNTWSKYVKYNHQFSGVNLNFQIKPSKYYIDAWLKILVNFDIIYANKQSKYTSKLHYQIPWNQLGAKRLAVRLALDPEGRL